MLSDAELSETAAEFGVAEDQVRRDHLISHLLRAVAHVDSPLTFFGGTALARTRLTDPARGGRLSEDIDLHTPERARLASDLDSALPRALRREFPSRRPDHAALFRPPGVRRLGKPTAPSDLGSWDARGCACHSHLGLRSRAGLG
jgi:hypothetical protein